MFFWLFFVLCFTFSTGLSAQNTFPDVKESDWYYEYVLMLTERGLVQGVSEESFAPDADITRAQFVQLLANIAEADLAAYAGATSFVDVPADSWYAAPVRWANESGLANGVGDNRFAPSKTVTREEAATLIQRFVDVTEGFDLPEVEAAQTFNDVERISAWAKEAVLTLQAATILGGDEKGNVNPQNNLKRSEACKIIASFYLYLTTFELDQYLEEHEEEIDREIEAAQEEMAELAANPATLSYFDNAPTDAPILNNYATPSGFYGGGFQFLDGDILYTSGVYQLGHIGMACGDGILEMVKKDNNAKTGPVKTSYANWAKTYKDRKTYVLRRIHKCCNWNSNCRNVSVKAAWYGKTYFLNGAGQNYRWQLLPLLSNTKKVNCSGLAYKCYRDGAKFYYKVHSIEPRTGRRYYVTPYTITPIEIFDDRVYNGFSAIYKF